MACRFIPRPSAPVHISEFMLGDLKRTGVYFLFREGELVYVGQTRTLKWRLDQHLADRRKVFDAVAFLPCTIDRLLEIEGHYIRAYAPRYNQCNIAKAAREAQSWRTAPRAPPKTVDASQVEMSLDEAAEFLRIPRDDVADCLGFGMIADLSLMTLVKFSNMLRMRV